MKYAVIIPDGCSDWPLDLLDGRTPLEAANLPAMDAIVTAGRLGTACYVPEGMHPGSDVANLSLLGYDPRESYTGRAPIEAIAQGISLSPHDWAIRCNLVTIENQIMKDSTAGHVASQEAAELLASLQEYVDRLDSGKERFEFHPGVSYRNLLICRGDQEKLPFSEHTRTVPPYELSDRSVADDYPRGPGSDLLVKLMGYSEKVFANHPTNKARLAEKKLPATTTWLWGGGHMPSLSPFAERFGIQGAMITGVDLLRGICRLLGWKQIDVPGATGYIDTDYAGKGAAAIAALDEVDLVCVHIEAPDEAGHEGDAVTKIKALEAIDENIIGPIHDALRSHGEYRILVSPDHPTPIETKKHYADPVPMAMAGIGIQPDKFKQFDEPTASASNWSFPVGHKVMETFIQRPDQSITKMNSATSEISTPESQTLNTL
ncbi:MAG: cofactor-independent phosphoglycerate mutase [Planctomycetia bacterium]|jgi:2,3-bisphosphoglycerate-independent phosphoglycerate mutase